jgi:hypothetical protein
VNNLLKRDIAYTLNPQTGEITWQPHSNVPLCKTVHSLSTQDKLLACIPDINHREHLMKRWRAVSFNESLMEPFTFTLLSANGRYIEVVETHLLRTGNIKETTLVGFWVEKRSGLMTFNNEV